MQKLFLKEQCIRSGAFSKALTDHWQRLPTRWGVSLRRGASRTEVCASVLCLGCPPSLVSREITHCCHTVVRSAATTRNNAPSSMSLQRPSEPTSLSAPSRAQRLRCDDVQLVRPFGIPACPIAYFRLKTCHYLSPGSSTPPPPDPKRKPPPRSRPPSASRPAPLK